VQKVSPTLPFIDHDESEIALFRRIHLLDYVEPVKSLAEAETLLQNNSRDARAHQYLGWRLLRGNEIVPDPEKALQSLKISVEEGVFLVIDRMSLRSDFSNVVLDPDSAQTWYLLGRTYMQLDPGQHVDPLREAHAAYQESVYRAGRSPPLWISIGVLFHRVNQYRNSLDALSRSIRLNPYLAGVWYNLGVLVSLHRPYH